MIKDYLAFGVLSAFAVPCAAFTVVWWGCATWEAAKFAAWLWGYSL